MNTLLLVIDFINDIIHLESKISSSADYIEEHKVIDNANAAIAKARIKNIPIVHVKIGFSKNYIECPTNSPVFNKSKAHKALQLGTWGTDFHEAMDVQAQDKIIIKHRVSALYATELATILCANNIDTVVICGVATNMTVELTARELHDRDYQVVILENACGAATRQIHQASLVTLARIGKIATVAAW